MLYSFNQCWIDTDKFELTLASHRVAVEPQVLDLLILLIENRERVVSKSEIHESIWKGRIVSDAALSSRIKAARRAVGDDGSTQCCIRTIHRRGFRFVADVDTGANPELKASHVVPVATTSRPASRPIMCYARNGSFQVAYYLFGNGPIDLMLAFGPVAHLDDYWDNPHFNRWLTCLGHLARVVIFDKRGAGLPNTVSPMSGMDERMDDVHAVMGAVGFERAVILSVSEGARYLEERIPDAQCLELPNKDYLPLVSDTAKITIETIANFLKNLPTVTIKNRILTTVIVAYFDKPVIGPVESDNQPSDEDRDIAITNALHQFRGQRIRRDNRILIATFDGPTRALQCALTIVRDLKQKGVLTQAGVHTGEVDVLNDDINGSVKDIARWAADVADAGEVVASGTVKTLVDGSHLTLVARGEPTNIEGNGRLYRVSG
nr:winged helix-turn-helix domain-containing protein [uncultured Halomonas sp.]